MAMHSGAATSKVLIALGTAGNVVQLFLFLPSYFIDSLTSIIDKLLIRFIFFWLGLAGSIVLRNGQLSDVLVQILVNL
jgi:hypothetical protein